MIDRADTQFTVNSIGDTGDLNPGDGSCFTGDFIVGDGGLEDECTLRAASQEANATPGADTIEFDIPGSGVKTVSPATDLPTISEAVTIDVYSQPGAEPNNLTVCRPDQVLHEIEHYTVFPDQLLRLPTCRSWRAAASSTDRWVESLAAATAYPHCFRYAAI